MKQRILHIITTFVAVGLAVTSLFVPALAEDEAQLYVEYFPIDSATMVINGDSLNVKQLLISDTKIITYGSVQVASDYDQYIGAKDINGNLIYPIYNPDDINLYGLILNYGDDWDRFDKSNVNYISLRFGIIVPSGWSVDSVPGQFFDITRNGISLADRYTLHTTFSNPIKAQVNGIGFGYYREVVCNVLFDNDLHFNSDDVIGFNLPACPIVPFYNESSGSYVGMYYNNGFDNLEVGYITTNQYLDKIVADIGKIQDTLDDTNNTLLDISDKLNEELTDDQQDTINIITGKVDEAESKGEYVEDNINDLASVADENAYDFEADDLQTIVDDNIQPVLDDEGFALFTEELFGNIWVYTSIPLVLFFVFIRYVVYGVG